MKHKETTKEVVYLVIVFCFLVLYVQIKMKSSQGNYSMVSCKTEWQLKSEGRWQWENAGSVGIEIVKLIAEDMLSFIPIPQIVCVCVCLNGQHH